MEDTVINHPTVPPHQPQVHPPPAVGHPGDTPPAKPKRKQTKAKAKAKRR